MEQATSYTWEPLQLSFRSKLGEPTVPLLLMCVVMVVTNYDILVGLQTLYPLGFGLDNWPDEAWIRPGWLAGKGKSEGNLFLWHLW